MASGLATMRSWPIIVAARATASRPAGTWLALVRPRPKSRAVRGRASGASRGASETKAVLHDCAKSVAKGTAPAAPPSKFLNSLPSTVIVFGQLTVSVVFSPARSSAVVVMTLNVEPGRVAAVDRAVVGGIRRAVGHREDVARRGLHGDQRRLRLAVAERVLGRLLDVAVERRVQLDALARGGGAAA